MRLVVMSEEYWEKSYRKQLEKMEEMERSVFLSEMFDCQQEPYTEEELEEMQRGFDKNK